MSTVSLHQISKTFTGRTAVSTIDLKIEDGEFLVLVGPSGCGKTTTLRMIAGLETPSSGDIFIGETNVTQVEPKDRDIAMVFQNYALYPHMTVRNNLAYGLKLRHHPREKINQQIKKTAAMLDMEALLDSYPKQLSGGQQQRVALGRAIVRQPQVFLMDEPLSNLDAKLRVATRAELIKLHRQLKTTTVYVTHDQIEAMTMGTRIVVMNHGTVQQIGRPLEIYQQPANSFVASFIGSPPMQLLTGTLVNSNSEWFFQGKGFQLALPSFSPPSNLSDNCLLGIRPEHLELSDPNSANSSSISCRVEWIENIGSEVLLHVKTVGEEPLIGKIINQKLIPAIDEIIALKPSGPLYLFAATDGKLQAILPTNQDQEAKK